MKGRITYILSMIAIIILMYQYLTGKTSFDNFRNGVLQEAEILDTNSGSFIL